MQQFRDVLSLPSRGAWIEILWMMVMRPSSLPSLPSRGAWIEIIKRDAYRLGMTVAPLAGSVDRNSASFSSLSEVRASLPSRGAWIEIQILHHVTSQVYVAPLAGSVDETIP